MARCYNCGCDISEEDKTRLCDDCKKVLLPFVKFMDASTSSAVRRLISNEENLRNAGVTDNGMEYLLRICELHDRSKNEDPEEQNEEEEYSDGLIEENVPAAGEQNSQSEEQQGQYSDIEVPLDKPLRLIRRTYGRNLAAAEIVLAIISFSLLVWFFVDLIAWSKVDFAAIAGCLASAVGVYVTESIRKMIYDVEQLKKHFR